jgi:2-hydroxymuconate-semialdehyde hydrolase
VSQNSVPVTQASPEIGSALRAGRLNTNYHDVGSGSAVLLIHGSGPGVSAWANWRLVLPRLKDRARALAPDMAGFGYTEVHGELSFDIDLWLEQLRSLLDTLGIQRVSIIGNSFGGGIALHFAARYPHRVEKIVLMGSVGARFPLTHGLDRVWGYQPSRDHMRELIGIFAYNKAIVTDDLVELRYQASIRADVQDRFSRLFPAPRQRWIDALALDESTLAALVQPVLLIHGREDQVIPLHASQALKEMLPNARLAVIEQCGHWVQIEHTDEFLREIVGFLELGAAPDSRAAP